MGRYDDEEELDDEDDEGLGDEEADEDTLKERMLEKEADRLLREAE